MYLWGHRCDRDEFVQLQRGPGTDKELRFFQAKYCPQPGPLYIGPVMAIVLHFQRTGTDLADALFPEPSTD